MSDFTSDEEELIPKPKKARKLKFLGNISLISSDEDSQISNKKQKTHLKKSTSLLTIEMLTSDEDTDEQKNKSKTVKKTTQKRPFFTSDVSEDNNSDYGPPSKKSKSKAVSKPKKKPTALKKKVPPTKNLTTVDIKTQWEDSEFLAFKCGIEQEVAQNLIRLLEEGNTIPFIARYRKDVTKNMAPDEVRKAKETFDDICKLKEKMVTVAKAIKQTGKLDEKLQSKISCSRTIEELEHIYAPYKPESKGTLANRARKLGLEKPALLLLNNSDQKVNLNNYVNESIEGLQTLDKVQDGVIIILSAEMAIDTEVLTFVRDLRQKTKFYLASNQKKTPTNKTKKNNTTSKGQCDNEKYETYFDKTFLVDNLKSYQILAINRGEAQKALTVKINVPDYFNSSYRSFSSRRWKTSDYERRKILGKAIEDSLTRYIQPLVIRQIRTELTNRAHRESTEIFSTNLKHLLMTPPLKGKHILGVDPGFKNGVKLAVISPTGKFLDSDVIYLHKTKNEQILKRLILNYECDIIGIGNGHACRQTEEFVAGLIKSKSFGKLNVMYTIVTEDGASIYSCSAEAKKEFGNLDPNIISAVSLARRLQDPLAELVKVEPNHLGIGMYQLDIKKKELDDALNDVVSECVSFVGVDLNTASQCLLKRVAGLSDKKANLIINYRESHGPFTHRRQLLDVYGIGEKCYQQCAGFLRIVPLDPNDKQFYNKKNTTALDSTIIHPESYSIARKIIQQAGLKEQDIGSEDFVNTFTSKKLSFDVDKLVESLDTSKETVHLIFDALSRKSSYDLRHDEGTAPLFKQNITEFDSLKPGMTLTGRITNVLQFGAFTDVGVERSGLIHVSKMNNIILNIGDRVEVKVLAIDVGKKRLNLEALAKL